MTAEHNGYKLIAQSIPLKRHAKYLIGIPGANKKLKLVEVKHIFAFGPE